MGTLSPLFAAGIVLIADRKYTNVRTGNGAFREKIFGDAAHFLIEFTGKFNAFDIFRNYIFGDILIRRDYTLMRFDQAIQ